MKKLFALLFCLLMVFSIAEENPDDAAMLKEKYEESVAFNALKTLCRIGTDDLSVWACDRVVKRPSEAWNCITKYDAGWFSTIRSSEYLDFSSENWTRTSDTTFECDVHGIQHILFAAEPVQIDYLLSYHLCFEQTNARTDTWMLTDFHCLPIQSEAEKAARLTAEYEGISVFPVTGKSFRGYVMIIDDPSRVFVGTTPAFDSSRGGMRVDALVERYGALGAVNGGGFEDAGGGGNGARPAGYVVSEGVLKNYNAPNNTGCNIVMGFTEENKLVVGKFQNAELESLHLRDALSFHPALLQDGKPVVINEKNITYTARTAIGQDEQGRVLLLVLQGRQPDSFGASYADEQEVLLSFGAVTAGNLDGGNSTAMYLGGESVYSAYPMNVSRRMPATFLIR